MTISVVIFGLLTSISQHLQEFSLLFLHSDSGLVATPSCCACASHLRKRSQGACSVVPGHQDRGRLVQA